MIRRRPLAAVAATLAAGLLLAAPAYATSTPTVVVRVVGAGGTTLAQRAFTPSDLTTLHDVVDAAYALQSTPNAPSTDIVGEGASLRALVAAVPLAGGGTVDPDSVTFTEVQDQNGESHPLDQGALGASGSNGFESGLMPVMYAVGTDAIGYIRPLHSSQDVNLSPDPNIGGYFQSDADGTLVVIVHTSGRLLHPVITVATTKPHVGDPVHATGSAPDATAGSTYAWDFGDGATAIGTSATHTWRAAGTYPLSLVVHGTDGSWGRAEPVVMYVDNKAIPNPTRSAGTGSDPGKHAPVAGPQKGGRATSGSADAPWARSTAPQPGGPAAQPVPMRVVTRSDASGAPIHGLLLTSVAAPTTAAPYAAGQAPATRLSLPTGLLIALAAVGLLGAGAWTERRKR